LISETDVRKLGAHALEQALEPLDPQLGIHAALDHDLGCALIGRPLDAPQDLVVRHRVPFAVLLGTKECTERTVHVADVRVVDRRVDHVGHVGRRIQGHASLMRGGAEIVQRGLCVEENAFFERQAAAVRSPVEQVS